MGYKFTFGTASCKMYAYRLAGLANYQFLNANGILFCEYQSLEIKIINMSLYQDTELEKTLNFSEYGYLKIAYSRLLQ